MNAQPFDLVLLLVLGALGFAMRRFGLPVLPAIIGVILGPRAELQLRRALQISGGEWSGLFSSPLAIGIYCLIVLILIWPLINRFVVRRLRKPAHGVHSGHAHPSSNWPRNWPPTPTTSTTTRASSPGPSG